MGVFRYLLSGVAVTHDAPLTTDNTKKVLHRNAVAMLF
jgi:hypothetical protein